MPNVPAPLDRNALERVLARAAELQVAESGESGEPAETLTEAQILELGKEVGLSPTALRQAIAEERTRVAAEVRHDGAMDRLVGAATVSAMRVITGRPAGVLAQVDDWMLRKEGLQVKRRYGERIVWESRRDLFSGLQRAFEGAFGGRRHAFVQAHEVAATAIAVDDARVALRLDADFATQRRALVGTGVGLGVFGAAASVAAVAMNVMVPVAVLPAIALTAVGAWQARKRQAQTLYEASLALEQLLDRLERGELARPSLLNVISSVAGALPRR